MKEKCKECFGEGNVLDSTPDAYTGLADEMNEKPCPNCEDGWVWKFSKVRECPECKY